MGHGGGTQSYPITKNGLNIHATLLVRLKKKIYVFCFSSFDLSFKIIDNWTGPYCWNDAMDVDFFVSPVSFCF